jgi:EthD domain-containing protein
MILPALRQLRGTAMFKLLLFCVRKPGISREEFKRLYEKVHIPLVDKLIADGISPPMLEWKRNYIVPDHPSNLGSAVPYDAITECVFSNADEFAKTRQLNDQEYYRKLLTDDLQQFLDLSKLSYLVVEVESVGGKKPS